MKSLKFKSIPQGELLFHGVFGSKLYGLETPDSDDDQRMVYAPEWCDVIFGEYEEAFSKNKQVLADGTVIDSAGFSLMKFIKCLERSDTNTIDMLFTPDEFTIYHDSYVWEHLRALREDVLCKNCRGLLGYIKTQSSKYGHKIQRYDELSDLISIFEKAPNVSIREAGLGELVQAAGYKFIKAVMEDKGDVKAHIDVLGKKYQLDAPVSWSLVQLRQNLSRYGDRTKAGSDRLSDAKSLSHAYRVILQLEQLIDTRELIFPLIPIIKKPVMAMKLGMYSQEEAMGRIDEAYDRVLEKLEASDLPEDSDLSPMRHIVLDYYS